MDVDDVRKSQSMYRLYGPVKRLNKTQRMYAVHVKI